MLLLTFRLASGTAKRRDVLVNLERRSIFNLSLHLVVEVAASACMDKMWFM